MKVMMLLWAEADAASGDQADFDVWVDFDRRVKEAGAFVLNGALQPPGQSLVIRPELAAAPPGEQVRPGTFTEGKAQIQAFYLIDAPDLAAAQDWARQLPTYGWVEFRPLLEYDY